MANEVVPYWLDVNGVVRHGNSFNMFAAGDQFIRKLCDYETGIDVQVAWNNCILVTVMGLTESDVDMMGVFDAFCKVMSVI